MSGSRRAWKRRLILPSSKANNVTLISFTGGHLGWHLFVRGWRHWRSTPGLMFWGAVPALAASVLLILALLCTVPHTYGWSRALTPFVEHWPLWGSEIVRVTLALALDVSIIYLAFALFVWLTLLLGTPFYERIATLTMRRLGEMPTWGERPIGQQFCDGVKEFVRTLDMAFRAAAIAFLLGLIPIVGALAAAFFLWWRGIHLLASELTVFAAEAHGWSFNDRRARCAAHPALTIGSVVGYTVLFLVPFVAVFAMPAAVVTGTLLVRTLDESGGEIETLANERR